MGEWAGNQGPLGLRRLQLGHELVDQPINLTRQCKYRGLNGYLCYMGGRGPYCDYGRTYPKTPILVLVIEAPM